MPAAAGVAIRAEVAAAKTPEGDAAAQARTTASTIDDEAARRDDDRRRPRRKKRRPRVEGKRRRHRAAAADPAPPTRRATRTTGTRTRTRDRPNGRRRVARRTIVVVARLRPLPPPHLDRLPSRRGRPPLQGPLRPPRPTAARRAATRKACRTYPSGRSSRIDTKC